MRSAFAAAVPMRLTSKPFAPPRRVRSVHMSVHHLRARTVSWLLPILPSGAQVVSACGDSARLYDLSACTIALALLGTGVLSVLPLLHPFARASISNSQARAAPHAALLLGTIEHGMFIEGARRPLSVPAPPALHGTPAAALILAHDPHCERVVRVEQVYVPSQDRFLVPSSRVRPKRFLEIVQNAYQL